jgi:hypothetical protein
MTKLLMSVGGLAFAAIVFSAPTHARPKGGLRYCLAWCYRHGDSQACYNECGTQVANRASVVRKGNTAPVRGGGLHR